MFLILVFQEAKILGLILQQSMTVGMTFQQDIIIELVLTTNYVYMYEISAGHDCKACLRAIDGFRAGLLCSPYL
jgi:hypothetical protein